MAEQAPETAMASAFRALGLPYVEGQTVLVGDDASMTYFDATTQAALLASGGVIGPSYDVRLTLAYTDVYDVTSFVSSLVQQASNDSGLNPAPGFTPPAVSASIAFVAGTVDSGSSSIDVAGIATVITEQGGNHRTSMVITSVHDTSGDAVVAAQRFRPVVAPYATNQPPMIPIGPNGEPTSTDCHLQEGCGARCACEYNACVDRAFKDFVDDVAILDANLLECILVAGLSAATFLYGSGGAFSWVALGIFLVFLAVCLANRAYSGKRIQDKYDRAIAACESARVACNFDCGIFEH
jgi:hypothetical protein